MKQRICILLSVCCFLCGCVQEQVNQEEASSQRVNYFFPEETISQEYTATFSGFYGQPEQKAVTVSVNEVQHFKEGTLYELKVDSKEEELNRYVEYRGKWQHIGFFLVKGDEIYLIRSEEIPNTFRSAEELQSAGTLVCNEAGKEDILGEDKKGQHEYIAVNGSRREYHAYDNTVETGYYECFIWEAGRGLIGSWSGYGARSNDIELLLPGEESVR